jgi:hypothetical protein
MPSDAVIRIAKREVTKRYAAIIGSVATAVVRANIDLLEMISRDYGLDFDELIARYGIAKSSLCKFFSRV